MFLDFEAMPQLAPPSTSRAFTSVTTTMTASEQSIPELQLDFSEDEQAYVLARARRLYRSGKISIDDICKFDPVPADDVTAIIPARNEAATIATVVRAVQQYVKCVIVVEGGSTDDTARRAAAAGAQLVCDQGLGKGAAMRLAVAQVQTPYCVFVDADGSHDAIDIPLLLAPLRNDEADQVNGSRMLGGSDELHGGGDEFLRLSGSAFITFLMNLRYGSRLSDCQNGFRAIRTNLFRSLDLKSRHITIEMEMVMASLAAGARIKEVPTRERRRAAGYSKFSLARPGIWLTVGWVLIRGLCRRRSISPTIPVL